MANLVFKGTKIYVNGSEPSSGKFPDFNNSTYYPYSSSNIEGSGYMQYSNDKYYVIGYGGSSYCITQFTFYTDTPISSFSLTLKSGGTAVTSSTYHHKAIVSTNSTLGTLGQSFINHTDDNSTTFYWSGANKNATITCNNLSIPAGTFYMYLGPGVDVKKYTLVYAKPSSNAAFDTSAVDKTYTVAYNANGGSGSTSSQTKTFGTTVNLSSNNFTAPRNAKNSLTIKDGNTTLTTNTYAKFSKNSFNCWTIDDEDYAAGAQYTITKDVTAYAKWNTVYTLQGKTLTKASTTKDGYTITYNANGGICDRTSETMTNTTEYTHNGWKDGTNSYGNSGDITISSNTTITSIYTENTVSGSTKLPTPIKGSSQDKNVTLYFHGAIEGETLTITYQKANSYEFKGWGESRNSSSGVTGDYTPLKNVTLYALWGTSLEIAYTTISLPTPTRKGFTFMGWALTEDASSGVFGEYTPETEITALHAIWKPNGAVRIQVNDLEGYKIALVYAQYENKWRQLIPYISDGNRWYLIGG